MKQTTVNSSWLKLTQTNPNKLKKPFSSLLDLNELKISLSLSLSLSFSVETRDIYLIFSFFFVFKFSRKAILLFFFFHCFKGFRWKKIFWKIIPTVPVITDLIRSSFSSLTNSLETQSFIYVSSTSLRGFIYRTFFPKS